MTRTFTFLSDFGAGSDYVGICHAVIARIAPAARVIDLAHSLPAGDVRAGAHVLARAIPYTEPGIHLAVVDPGVGTDRRALAVGSADQRVFVGPDNGLLAPGLAAAGGAVWAREISQSPYRAKPVSRSFWGRDVFAPVAAALAAGAEPSALGEQIDPEAIEPGPSRGVEVGKGELRSPIAYVDAFGNLVLTASWPELVEAGLAGPGPLGANALNLVIGRRRGVASVGEATYAEVEQGALLVRPDSFGAVEIARNGASAAEELEADGGERVKLSRRR